MEYDIGERFRLMAQTALYDEHLPNVTAAATDTAKQVIVYILVAAFSATGTIHLQLPQDDKILFQLQSQSHDSHETCLHMRSVCVLQNKIIP